MRKTKIVCTIGPASDNEEVLTNMCLAGMNVARLNFSHGTHKEHKERIDDTKGPEYRIKTFANKKVTLSDGDIFRFTTDDIIGDEKRVSVSYKNLTDELNVGDTILVNNGLVIFSVQKIEKNDVVCVVKAGGVLSDRKSMNFPNHVLNNAYLSDQDKEDILFGIENDIDFIAASFVSNKENLEDLRNFMDQNSGHDIDIIAKIENHAGVENIEDICEIADGIMVARGDLGVEIPFIEVPAVQKYLIKKCRLLGKRVITATEMLESMIHNPRPTRAEISDVANAVYDGTSTVMLSGESAVGKYPVDAVRNMSEISEFTEKNIDYIRWFHDTVYHIRNNSDAVSHATCAMAIDTNAKGIVVSSLSGTTVCLVSRFRCPVDIIGMTTSEKVWRKLNLSWGVTPVLSAEFHSVDVMFYHALNHAKQIFKLQSDDNVILTGGQTSGKSGNTNTIRLEQA